MAIVEPGTSPIDKLNEEKDTLPTNQMAVNPPKPVLPTAPSINPSAIRLIAATSFSNGMGDDIVVFDATPTFTENRSVVYSQLSPIHLPGEYQVYRNTKSRTFSIGAKFISTTPEQAELNMIYLQRLRAWCMPYFGKLDGISQVVPQPQGGSGLLGAPPDVLYLWAYAPYDNGIRAASTYVDGFGLANINKVPVVLTSLNIEYPQNITYINTTSGVPFPIVMTASIDLAETHSPLQYESFDLMQYKNGLLGGF